MGSVLFVRPATCRKSPGLEFLYKFSKTKENEQKNSRLKYLNAQQPGSPNCEDNLKVLQVGFLAPILF